MSIDSHKVVPHNVWKWTNTGFFLINVMEAQKSGKSCSVKRKADRASKAATSKESSSFCGFPAPWHNSDFNYSVSSDIPSPVFGSVNMITDSVFVCFQTWVECWSANEFTGNLALVPAAVHLYPKALVPEPISFSTYRGHSPHGPLPYCPGIKETGFSHH